MKIQYQNQLSSSFCRAHERDKQTQTNRPTISAVKTKFFSQLIIDLLKMVFYR